MALTDNLEVQVYPVSGETAIKNIVDDTLFSGTGTPVMSTANSEDAWSIPSGADLRADIVSKTIADTWGNSNGTGVTFALRLQINTQGDTFQDLAGVGGTTSGIARIQKQGTNNLRGLLSAAFCRPAIATTYSSATRTFVFRIEMSSTVSDVGAAWIDTVSRVGDSPDATHSSGASQTGAATKAFIRGITNGAYKLVDFAYWSREMTDAECASVADDYRVVMPSAGASSGTITTQALKNNTGTLLANETSVIVDIYNVSTGALILHSATETTDASAILTITDAALVVATAYTVVIRLSTNALGVDEITAT